MESKVYANVEFVYSKYLSITWSFKLIKFDLGFEYNTQQDFLKGEKILNKPSDA